VELGFPSVGDPLIPSARVVKSTKSKNSPNGGGIGDLCGGGGGRGGGGGYDRVWRGLGAWHRNPRDDLRASFRNRGRGAPELTGEHNGPIITGSPGACGHLQRGMQGERSKRAVQ
jgi:hypothetical protein